MKPYGKASVNQLKTADNAPLDAYYHKGRGGVLAGSVPLSSHTDLQPRDVASQQQEAVMAM
jgi:hypothetical protein